MSPVKPLLSDKMLEAFENSYYFIAGTGGEIDEWINGYEDLMKKEDIGTPKVWYLTTGDVVNNFFIRSS